MRNAFGITNCGAARARNEDCIYCHPHGDLFIVADGMGGHAMGDFASRTATRIFIECMEKRFGRYRDEEMIALLQDSVIRANREIFQFSRSLPEPCIMGTTIASAFFTSNRLYTVHIGDSRIYRQRDGRLQRLTTDHTVAQEMLEAGEIGPDQVDNHPQNHLLTRAVGAFEHLIPEVNVHRVLPSDRFLLSSDGLFRAVPQRTVSAMIKDDGSLETRCSRLVEMALRAGAPDNLSVILVEPQSRTGIFKKLFGMGRGAR